MPCRVCAAQSEPNTNPSALGIESSKLQLAAIVVCCWKDTKGIGHFRQPVVTNVEICGTCKATVGGTDAEPDDVVIEPDDFELDSATQLVLQST